MISLHSAAALMGSADHLATQPSEPLRTSHLRRRVSGDSARSVLSHQNHCAQCRHREFAECSWKYRREWHPDTARKNKGRLW